MERGKYIVIEGSDGTGKSTQINLLQARLKAEAGIDSIQIHEPDGYEGSRELGLPRVSKAIELRKIIKNATISRTPWENVEMFTEARRLNWQQAMQPALERGIWVLAARSYISTIAYQGYGEGIAIDEILDYTKQQVGEAYLHPQLELVLVLGNETVRQARIGARGELEHPDTFESMSGEFQTTMMDGYRQLASERQIETLDAAQPIPTVAGEVWKRVTKLL